MKFLFGLIKYILLLNITSYSAEFNPHRQFCSAVIRGNKLYAFSNMYYDDDKPKFSEYTLNTRDIQAIINNRTDLKFEKLAENYQPQLLDFQTQDLNQLFFMGGQIYQSLNSSNIEKDELLSTYDLGSSTMTYRNRNVMKQPTFEKFPQYYYSSTAVQVPQSDGSTQTVIYIFGGYIYSPKLKKQALTNLFYSYNINTKEWKDLNESVNRDDIPPLGGHTAVLVENRYIYMLGGLTWPKGNYTDQVANSASGPPATSLKNIIYYDTQNDSWTKKSAAALAHVEQMENAVFGFTGNYYDNNIVVFGGFLNDNNAPNDGAAYNTLFARYNVKTLQWNFTSIASNSDKDIKSPLFGYGASVIYNNQLILTDGTRLKKKDFNERMYVIDLNSDRVVNTLNLIAEKPKDEDLLSSEKGSSSFPVYGIVLIVLAILAILAIIAFIYYRKRKNQKYNGYTDNARNTAPIQEVWADNNNRKSLANPQNNLYNDRSGYNSHKGNQSSTNATGSSDTKVIYDLPHFKHEQEVDFSNENNDNLANDYSRH